MKRTEAYLIHRIQFESLPWDNRCYIADELVARFEGYEVTERITGPNNMMTIECHGFVVAKFSECNCMGSQE